MALNFPKPIKVLDVQGLTNVDRTVAVRIPDHGQVVGVYVGDAGGAYAASDTDYHTVTLTNKGGAGAGTTAVATANTKAASLNGLVRHVPKAVTLSTTPADLLVSPGDVLELAVAKSGSGTFTTGWVEVWVQYGQ